MKLIKCADCGMLFKGNGNLKRCPACWITHREIRLSNKNKRSYERNKEKRLANLRKYYNENKEELNQKHKEYYYEHRDEINEKRRNKRKMNKMSVAKTDS